MINFCRLCLREILDQDFISGKDTSYVELQLQLSHCMPDMILESITEPVICGLCVALVRTIYFFTFRCQQTEKKIKSYLQKMSLKECNIFDICYKRAAAVRPKETILTDMSNNQNRSETASASEFEQSIERNCITNDSMFSTFIDEELQNDTDFVCDRCGYSTALEYIFIWHNKVFHKEVPLQCPDCSYQTYCEDSLSKHLVIHTDAIKEKATLQENITIICANSPAEFSCNLCIFQTNSKASFTNHLMTHKEKFNCHLCGYNSYSVNYFVRHQQLHKIQSPSNILKKKNLSHPRHSLATNNSIRKLSKKCSTAKVTHSCTKCTFKTTSQMVLKRHLNRHNCSLLKSFSCSFCDFRSKHEANLKSHILELHQRIMILDSAPDEMDALISTASGIKSEIV